MQETKFDEDSARKHLKAKETARAAELEKMRLELLSKAMDVLQHEFKNKNSEVWLIGSITRPHQFGKRSDIDIVVKNYLEDRFDLWALLEKKIGHEIEIIRYEECDFQDEIQINGLKVI